MFPEDTKESTARAAGETNKLIQDFLLGRIEAVRTVAEWSRTIAVHKTWGFESPEDVVQATLLALVQNLREGRFQAGDLRAYVRRITKNMCITNYRRIKSRGEHVSLEDANPHPAVRTSGEQIERNLLIEQILARLGESCRQIIVFAYLKGYSRKEISKHLGISEEAARVKLCRCIQHARALMESPADEGMERA